MVISGVFSVMQLNSHSQMMLWLLRNHPRVETEGLSLVALVKRKARLG
jgi:predicted tellurium resistance membrane protein TerC